MDVIKYFNKANIDSMLNYHFRRGCLLTLPLALSAATYGSVLGMLAADKNMTVLELLTLNIFMFAGSSQFLVVEMWQPQLAIGALLAAVLAMNVRYFLASVSISPLFKHSSLFHKITIIFNSGNHGLYALILTTVNMIITKSILLSMCVGVFAMILLRQYL
ncbi:AzlC family ABC transporter permease [uncultured Shewanella sp.]|uniref:AzlC family ABC transporter permease n=1 Tax=uncultured Shewanella sp. TaxID=173975 RepID=UPI00262D3FFE|nr:AzlC family ABC transporter permease [uncultured Shewanella sp.]